MFGYISEDIKIFLELMIWWGDDFVGVMGIDMLFVVFFDWLKLFYNYFK